MKWKFYFQRSYVHACIFQGSREGADDETSRYSCHSAFSFLDLDSSGWVSWCHTSRHSAHGEPVFLPLPALNKHEDNYCAQWWASIQSLCSSLSLISAFIIPICCGARNKQCILKYRAKLGDMLTALSWAEVGRMPWAL